MTYGFQNGALVAPTFQEIRSDLADAFKDALGASINTNPQSRFGMLIDTFAAREFALWELAEAVYGSGFRSSAVDTSLDNKVAEQGLQRLPASRSRVAVTFEGDAGTVITAVKRCKLASTGTIWRPEQTYTIGGGGDVEGFLVADEVGPLDATTGDTFEIDSPVAGWDSVTIDENAEVGRLVETNSELRQRADRALQVARGPTFNGLVARLLATEGVTNVGVVVNATALTVNGTPPYSFVPVVTGGLAADILAAVFESTPVGLSSFGTESGTISAVNGQNFTVYYSRPASVSIYVDITITASGVTYPGDAAVKQIILDFGNTLAPGESVRYLAVANAIFDNVPGVTALTVELGTVSIGAATVQNITIDDLSIADFDLANIAVTSS